MILEYTDCNISPGIFPYKRLCRKFIPTTSTTTTTLDLHEVGLIFGANRKLTTPKRFNKASSGFHVMVSIF